MNATHLTSQAQAFRVAANMSAAQWYYVPDAGTGADLVNGTNDLLFRSFIRTYSCVNVIDLGCQLTCFRRILMTEARTSATKVDSSTRLICTTTRVTSH